MGGRTANSTYNSYNFGTTMVSGLTYYNALDLQQLVVLSDNQRLLAWKDYTTEVLKISYVSNT